MIFLQGQTSVDVEQRINELNRETSLIGKKFGLGVKFLCK